MDMLKQILLRWACNGIGLWIAAHLLPGIEYSDSLWVIVIASLIFSIVNALIRPLVVILSLPAIVVTLGFFTLIINALMLYLVTVLYSSFEVNSFGAAILAVMIVWLVNFALNSILQTKEATHA